MTRICNNCKKHFCSNLRLTTHIKAGVCKKPFRCEACGGYYKTEKYLKQHQYQCPAKKKRELGFEDKVEDKAEPVKPDNKVPDKANDALNSKDSETTHLNGGSNEINQTELKVVTTNKIHQTISDSFLTQNFRRIPKLIDKGSELFNSIKMFARGLPSCDPLNIDLNAKNILMVLLSKCANSRDLSDFGNYALRLSVENRHKLLKSETAYDKKQLRIIVWENQFGEIGSAKCPLCNQTSLRSYASDWDIGHIISRKEGGPLIEPNLRPICKGCNLMIGSESLYIYARAISGALDRLKLVDFLKEIPYDDPSRFQERLDKEQLDMRMKLLDKRENLAQEKEILRKEKYELLKEKENLTKEKESYREQLEKEFESFKEQILIEKETYKIQLSKEVEIMKMQLRKDIKLALVLLD